MTPPLEISKKHGDDSSSFRVGSISRSFRSVPELAHEALIRDLAECSDNEQLDTETPLSFLSDESEDEEGHVHHTPTLYRRPEGVAFGAARPSIGLVPPAHDEPHLTRVEKKECRDAERSLLRDNHFLPPKHPVPEHPSLLHRVYKRIFSTKVRESKHNVFDEEAPCENTPLLKTASHSKPGHENCGHEHLNEQWDAAVAAGQIHTTWQREAKTITLYSRSLILTFILHYSVTVTAIIAAGRIGAAELGAVSRKSIKTFLLQILSKLETSKAIEVTENKETNLNYAALHSGNDDRQHYLLCAFSRPNNGPGHVMCSGLWVRTQTFSGITSSAYEFILDNFIHPHCHRLVVCCRYTPASSPE